MVAELLAQPEAVTGREESEAKAAIEVMDAVLDDYLTPEFRKSFDADDQIEKIQTFLNQLEESTSGPTPALVPEPEAVDPEQSADLQPIPVESSANDSPALPEVEEKFEKLFVPRMNQSQMAGSGNDSGSESTDEGELDAMDHSVIANLEESMVNVRIHASPKESARERLLVDKKVIDVKQIVKKKAAGRPELKKQMSEMIHDDAQAEPEAVEEVVSTAKSVSGENASFFGGGLFQNILGQVASGIQQPQEAKTRTRKPVKDAGSDHDFSGLINIIGGAISDAVSKPASADALRKQEAEDDVMERNLMDQMIGPVTHHDSPKPEEEVKRPEPQPEARGLIPDGLKDQAGAFLQSGFVQDLIGQAIGQATKPDPPQPKEVKAPKLQPESAASIPDGLRDQAGAFLQSGFVQDLIGQAIGQATKPDPPQPKEVKAPEPQPESTGSIPDGLKDQAGAFLQSEFVQNLIGQAIGQTTKPVPPQPKEVKAPEPQPESAGLIPDGLKDQAGAFLQSGFVQDLIGQAIGQATKPDPPKPREEVKAPEPQPESAGLIPDGLKDQAGVILQSDYIQNLIGQAIGQAMNSNSNQGKPEAKIPDSGQSTGGFLPAGFQKNAEEIMEKIMVQNIIDQVSSKLTEPDESKASSIAGMLPDELKKQAVNLLHTEYAKNIIGQAINQITSAKHQQSGPDSNPADSGLSSMIPDGLKQQAGDMLQQMMVKNIVDKVTGKTNGSQPSKTEVQPESAGLISDGLKDQAGAILQSGFVQNLIGQAIGQATKPDPPQPKEVRAPAPQPESAGSISDGLKDQGIKVVGRTWPGYDSWSRISVGTPEETDACVKALKAVLA